MDLSVLLFVCLSVVLHVYLLVALVELLIVLFAIISASLFIIPPFLLDIMIGNNFLDIWF